MTFDARNTPKGPTGNYGDLLPKDRAELVCNSHELWNRILTKSAIITETYLLRIESGIGVQIS